MGRLIDADALKERAIKVSTVKGHIYMKAVGTAEIDRAPTVEAVPAIHGRWENREGYDSWNCSECNFEICGYDDNPANYTDARYCSRCGAKMDG